MSVSISRHLVIDSIVDFYQILIKREYIIQLSPVLVKYRDYMVAYLMGCLCETDVNYQKVVEIYQSLNHSVESMVWLELKNSIGCESIQFYWKDGQNCRQLFTV